MSNKRLLKEFKDIMKESIPNIYTQPDEDNILLWNYIIIPSKEPYKGGYYHGILEFHKDYPMKPPSIKMFTPSGRFETNTRICLSMSDYHPETWNPSWGVRTILLGLYSFMIEDHFSDGTIGSIMDSFDNRKKLALSSYDYNLSNKKFQELCKELIHVKSVKHNPQHDKMICRYCFEDTGTLIAPCNCEGSNKYVHQECLAKWQYNSILSQSTHPKYQTNIEKICNVCGSEFKFKEYSRDKLMLQFTGKEIANMINKGCYLVSSKKSSSSNLELMNKHKNNRELCNNLKHWTKSIFLVTNIQGKDDNIHILGISMTNVISVDDYPPLYFTWIKLDRHPFFQNKSKVTHFIGGPCNPNIPFYLINIKESSLKNIDLERFNIVKVVTDMENTFIFGQLYELLGNLGYQYLDTLNYISIIWGIAGWSKTQLLGEIARGGWGLSKPKIIDNIILKNNLWNYFLEKEKILFCGNNDYLKIFQ